MTDLADKALLPAGANDALPPFAAFEAEQVAQLLSAFALRGYERVSPPLFEFEESLLTGSGAATASQAFRLMDPESRRMMAIRPDMTPQIARIATTRLTHAPRPLRLSYGGPVLRIRGSQMRPERAFQQVGAELIGPTGAQADAEVIVMAAEALSAIGMAALSVDLTLPALVPSLVDALGLSEPDARSLRTVLDRKDAAALHELCARLGDDAGRLLPGLLDASGPADTARKALAALDLPDAAAAIVEELNGLLDRLRLDAPDLPLTVDAVETRGFEYHSGVTFTLFARGVRGELGRGGRYRVGADGASDGEPATGFTLYMDSVLRGLGAPDRCDRVYVPHDTPQQSARALRDTGRIAVQGLGPVDDLNEEARRLGCNHILADGDVRPVTA